MFRTLLICTTLTLNVSIIAVASVAVAYLTH